MSRRKKEIGDLWENLNSTRHKLEEEQKKTKQMADDFESALDREIVKVVRRQFESDGDLVQLLMSLKAGESQIRVVPADPGGSEDAVSENGMAEGSMPEEEEEYGDD